MKGAGDQSGDPHENAGQNRFQEAGHEEATTAPASSTATSIFTIRLLIGHFHHTNK
jgi:hypothetical protein